MYGTAISQIIGDALDCFDGLDALFCLTLPGGEFRCIQIKKPPKIFLQNFSFHTILIRSKWKDCLTGHLTGDDLQVESITPIGGFA